MALKKEFTMETRDDPPSHFLLKIRSFSLLSENEPKEFQSKEFEAGGYKWRLVIYPDGDEDNKNHDHISLHFVLSDTDSLPKDSEINAIFSIFLYDHISDNYLCFRGKVCCLHPGASIKKYPKLISKKSFMDPSRGFLVGDKCVFGAEVFIKKKDTVVEFLSLTKVTTTFTPPYSMEWKISNFSKLNYIWTSKKFKTGEYKWNIKLYPTGTGESKNRDISIFLCSLNRGTKAKVKADYCLTIENPKNKLNKTWKASNWFSSSSSTWGWPKFISITQMLDAGEGFLSDDSCLLKVEISNLVSIDNVSD